MHMRLLNLCMCKKISVGPKFELAYCLCCWFPPTPQNMLVLLISTHPQKTCLCCWFPPTPQNNGEWIGYAKFLLGTRVYLVPCYGQVFHPGCIFASISPHIDRFQMTSINQLLKMSECVND